MEKTMSHITIHTKDNGDLVWPRARVHLNARPEDPQNHLTGIPSGYHLMSPEQVLYEITEQEYNRLQAILCDPMIPGAIPGGPAAPILGPTVDPNINPVGDDIPFEGEAPAVIPEVVQEAMKGAEVTYDLKDHAAKLTDDSFMPFGKYGKPPSGPKKMKDVPADYLHYLWTQGLKDDTNNAVHHYIKDNMKALQQEHPDGIWT